jgi:hypothetical protein
MPMLEMRAALGDFRLELIAMMYGYGWHMGFWLDVSRSHDSHIVASSVIA